MPPSSGSASTLSGCVRDSSAESRRAEWTQAIYDLLIDGQWHPKKEVLAAGMKVVPPAVGFRKGEWNRRVHYKKRGKVEDFAIDKRTRGTREDSIRVGSRMIVINTVRQMRNMGRVEERLTSDGKDKEYRLTKVGLEKAQPPTKSQYQKSKTSAGQIEVAKELQPEFFVAPGASAKVQFGFNLPLRRWELRGHDGKVIRTFDELSPKEVQHWTSFAKNSK